MQGKTFWVSFLQYLAHKAPDNIAAVDKLIDFSVAELPDDKDVDMADPAGTQLDSFHNSMVPDSTKTVQERFE